MRFRLLAAVLLAAACYQPNRLIDPAPYAPAANPPADAADPSQPGRFAVKRLYYGSGTDKRRREYRDSVTMRTPVVNGTPFIRGADPKRLKERWAYWGFDGKRLPINARVWYPDGPGPFPLVLIVHGNHDMRQFSDPGYAYLGELLASRGYILASVDENFLNGNLRGENDARGWMLLQHLVQWRRFNEDATSPLHGKVDMTRIALMGHSRGGEAVAVAAAFNRLSRYPDDARVTFNFGFDIRTLVAIAPVDGQYRPADQGTPLTNLNYLVLHGAHDADVSTFMGQRQYQRVRFTEPGPWRKAAIYINRANHGQFNTVWGSSDVGPEQGLFLNKKTLLTGDEQRQVGKVFISAFLDLTLRNASAYEPIFRNARAAGPWVPRTVFLTRYEAPGTQRLASFEEDVDVTTGSVPGVSLSATGVTAWRELGLTMRARGLTPYENHVARIGWSAPKGGAAAARYDVRVSDDAATSLHLDRSATLVFEAESETDKPRALAVSDTAPGKGAMPKPSHFDWLPGWLKRAPRDTTKGKGKDAAKSPTAPADSAAKPKGSKKPDAPPMDFRVELETSDGVKASVAIGELEPLPPPLEIRLYKWARSERKYRDGVGDVDRVLTSYAVPMQRLMASTPGFDPAKVRTIRFVFDRTPAGSVLLDGIGFEHTPR